MSSNSTSRGVAVDKLINEISVLIAWLDRPPKSSEMDEYGAYSSTTYRNRFGSWNDAISTCLRIERPQHAKYSKEDLLEELVELSERLGSRPRAKDIREKSEYSVTTYQDKFGSLSVAIKKAGLTAHSKQDSISTEELLEELRRLYSKLSRPPTYRDVQKHGKYSPTPYRTRWNRWEDALQEAGIDETPSRHRITTEELIEELRAGYEAKGETPTSTDMNVYGEFSHALYIQRFGSWRDALLAADIPIEDSDTDNRSDSNSNSGN